jgi:NAD(P)-dependent dehydrogenase (short-subunit alcohol dehydrogenase family)
LGGVDSLCLGLSNQLISKGIRVNALSYFEGGIWQNFENGSPDLYKMAMSLNPTSRMGTPQEVAAGVVFVASPVASRISGTNLIIDGALTKAVLTIAGGIRDVRLRTHRLRDRVYLYRCRFLDRLALTICT